MLQFSFANSKVNSSLFVYSHNNTIYYSLIYMDDLVIIGNISQFMCSIIDQLGWKFSLKDIGTLYYFLGVEVLPTQDDIFLSQHKYIHDLLHNTKMIGAKEICTPLSRSLLLKLHDGTASFDGIEYKMVLGSLKYLSLTRLDMSFVMNKLSQFMHKPTQTHWITTKRMLYHLKQTIFHGLKLTRRIYPSLTIFFYVDWVSNLDD